jgi:hypothetical protein
MLKKFAIFAILGALMLPVTARAENNMHSIYSLAGDMDYFGGSCYRCYDVGHGPDDGVFDYWDKGNKSWTHTYTSLPNGSITSAKLTIELYSFDLHPEFEDMDLALYIDGKELPYAFDTLPTESQSPVNTFVFNLDSSFYSSLEDGTALIEVKNNGTLIEHFAIDYAILEINYIDKKQVNIDIKPGSDPSSYGAKSKGKIPVALFGSSTFDVSQVDDSSVRFGDREDSGAFAVKVGTEDSNGDGYMDKVYHFSFPETNLDENDTTGYLSGSLFDGTHFAGSSDVNIVGNNKTVGVSSNEEVTEVNDNNEKKKNKNEKIK